MLPDKIEHCIVFMNYWDVSGVFWSFSKCNIKIPHLPADPSSGHTMARFVALAILEHPPSPPVRAGPIHVMGRAVHSRVHTLPSRDSREYVIAPTAL